jgi:cell division protein FtsB
MVLLHLILLALLGLSQWALWHGDGGFRTLAALEEATLTQVEENARLTERNRALAAEVADLKQGLQAVEELARSDLGFIRKGETFFHVIGTDPVGSPRSE